MVQFGGGRKFDIVGGMKNGMQVMVRWALVGMGSWVAGWGLTPPEQELKDGAGRTVIRYAVAAPAGLAPAGTGDPRRQVGLFLCFPEHDRPTGDEMLPVRAALERLGLAEQFVVVGAHPQERKFGVADHEPVKRLLEWAKKTYPINPRRVYLYGKGEGGKIAGQMAMSFPDLYAASISYSWTWWLMPSHVQPFDAEREGPGIYMVLGLRDLAHHLTNVRDGYSRVQAKGYPVIYREVPDLGERTYHPVTNDDAVGWAVAQRNKRLPLSAGERALLEKGTGAGLALVGGAAAGAVVKRRLTPEAVRVCGQTNCGEEALAAIGSLPATPETVRVLAVNANWRSQAAQAALIRMARGAGPYRELAVDGLITAMRLQIPGVQQDAAVFAALVGLLQDPDEELRTMVNNALATMRDRDFRGDLGRKQNREPEGGWERWLAEMTAKAAGYGPLGSFAETRAAAEGGDVGAAARLGMLYVVGNGTEQNFGEAERWLKKAAEGGHRMAARNLSMLYTGAPGMGGKPELAKRWRAFADGGE